MEAIIVLVILLVFPVICAVIATSKGRSGVAWFIIGFFAPVLALILVCVLPDQKAADRRYNRIGKQNRLLRERLRQSQIANRRRLDMLNRRLAAHDRSLNIDTSQSDAEPLPLYDEEPEPEPAPPPRARTTSAYAPARRGTSAPRTRRRS